MNIALATEGGQTGQGRGPGRVVRAGEGAGQGGQGRGQMKSKTKTSQWSKVTGTHGGLHNGRRPRAPTGDYTMAEGHGHPLVYK
jgi:hypothetical protein